MANPPQILIIAAALVCLIISLPAETAAPEEFYVDGDVYCEVCRVNFINRLSERMAGARVRLECRGEGAKNITYSVEGDTDANGHYQLKVEGDHDEEECAVVLVKSNRPDCEEIPDEGWASKPTSIVTLTKKNGFHGDTRHANPLGFLKKDVLPQCDDLIKELKLSDSDDNDEH